MLLLGAPKQFFVSVITYDDFFVAKNIFEVIIRYELINKR